MKIFTLLLVFGVLFPLSCFSQDTSYFKEFEKGLKYYEAEENELSFFAFSKVINIYPDSALVYYYRSKALRRLNRMEEGFEDIKKAIDLNPVYSDFYVLRAFYKSYIFEDNKDAFSDIETALKIDSTNSDAYIQRGLYRGELNTNSKSEIVYEVISDYSKAIFFNPNNPIPYFNRGMEFIVELKDTSNACIDFVKARELGLEYAEEMIKQYCNQKKQ